MAMSPEDREYFEQAISEVLGVNVATLQQAVTFIQGQQIEHNLKPVRDAWGDKFDENFAATKEYFDSLPEDKQAFYDNPEGLQYLFDKYVAPKMTAEGQTQQEASGEIPTVISGNSTGSAPATNPDALTREKIMAMPKSEYAQRSAEIAQFYATESASAS